MFNAGLCTSFLHSLQLIFSGALFDTMYEDIDVNEFHPAMGAASCFDAPEDVLNEHTSDFIIFLTTQKSGSTWAQRRLNTHPQMSILGESLLDFSRDCRQTEAGSCTWAEFKQQLDYLYETRRKDVKVAGFNLMYDHIPLEYRPLVADWAGCRNAYVVHLVRSASVESFWTLQIQLQDMVQLGEYKDRNNVNEAPIAGKLSSNKNKINLDPSLAADYVTSLESHRELYRRMFRYHPGVRYTEIFYESLSHADASIAKMHWNQVQAFVGVSVAPMQDTLQRLHPGTCKTKIANYNEVMLALKGTTAEWACQGQVQPDHAPTQ
jgi:hypothetical protein